ncbi:MAG: hypothetical protein ACKVRP_09910 [Bacteroidota bacterium]
MTFSSLLRKLLFLPMVVPFSVLSQWSDDTALNTPVCVQPNDQQLPVIATDGQGGAIIVWSDKRSGLTNPDIYAQRIDANGIPLWSLNGIPICTDLSAQFSPEVILDQSGGAFIVWLDERDGSADIYAQRVNASGIPQWETNGVAVVTTNGSQSDHVITTDDEGGIIAVWQDTRTDAGDIYVQRLNTAGVVLWGLNGMPVCNASGKQSEPTVAADGANGIVVAWTDERTGDADVFAQRLDSSGLPLWTSNGVGVVTIPEAHILPTIISDGNYGAIIAWDDWRSTDQQIYTQRLDSIGTPLWQMNGRYISDLVGNQLKTTMISDGQGGAIFAYQGNFLGDGIDIYAERIDGNGEALWDSNGVLVTPFDPNQTGLNMIADGERGVIVAWADVRNVPGWDVYAQRLDSSGAVLWDSTGVPVATAENFQAFNLMVSDDNGGAIVVWQDNRNGLEEDVYAQRVAANGATPNETTIPFASGWNLISVPRVPADFSASSLLPGVVAGSVHSFDGGYVQADTLENGPGYWARFGASGSITIEGSFLDSIAIPVSAGNSWVIIGSLSVPVPASAITSIPDGAILPGTLYGYSGGMYYRAETIYPGRAYWLFVNQPCEINISTP